MFEVMLLARTIDERQWVLNRQGREAFHISCQGHEGSGVGSAFALDRDRDVMVPYYRSLAAVLAFGEASGDRHVVRDAPRVLNEEAPIGNHHLHIGASGSDDSLRYQISQNI